MGVAVEKRVLGALLVVYDQRDCNTCAIGPLDAGRMLAVADEVSGIVASW